MYYSLPPPPPPLALPPSMILSVSNISQKPTMGESPFVGLGFSTHVTHISSLAGIIQFKIRRDFRLLRNFSDALGSAGHLTSGHPIRLLATDYRQKFWFCKTGRKRPRLKSRQKFCMATSVSDQHRRRTTSRRVASDTALPRLLDFMGRSCSFFCMDVC